MPALMQQLKLCEYLTNLTESFFVIGKANCYLSISLLSCSDYKFLRVEVLPLVVFCCQDATS